MSNRQKNYHDMLAACREQSTGWLERCHAEPGPHQNKIARLAVRNVLRERHDAERVPFVDVCHETAYGTTVRFSRAIRVF